MPQTLKIPPVQHVARIVSNPTVPRAAEAYRSWLDDGAGSFGYDPFRNAKVDYLAGRCSQSEAEEACASRGAPAGRKQNVALVRLAFPLLAPRVGFGRKLNRDRFSFRRDLSTSVGPLAVCLEQRQPVIIATQPAKSWLVEEAQAWRLWATIIHRVHAADDGPLLFDDAPAPLIEIIDLSAPPGRPRTVRVHRFAVADLLSDAELTAYLQCFAEAHDALVAEGYSPPQRQGVRPEDEDDLFTPPQ